MPIQLSNTLSQLNTQQLCKAKLVTFLEWQSFLQVPVGGFFPVITNEFEGIIQYFKWGLVPVWAKTIEIGNNMAKTKLENLQEKPALQAIYQYKRCIIPVTEFTIWANSKKTNAIAIAAPPNNLFYLMGLWSVWGEGLQTFSVLTQVKNFNNELVDMPLQIPFHQIPVWLQRKAICMDVLEKLKR